MEKNKLIPIVAGVVFLILIQVVGFKITERVLEDRLTPKVTQQVVNYLKRSYTPGPYSPGFNPDKVDPRLHSSLDSQESQVDFNRRSWVQNWEDFRRQ